MKETGTDHGVTEGWTLYFVGNSYIPPNFAADPVAVRYRDVLERAYGRMRAGQPVFLGPGGVADARVNRWFVSDELGNASRTTWRKYAYSLLVWLNFLAAYGVSWDRAGREAQSAFKVWRLSDARNPSRVAPGTYEHDLIALRLFYRWACGEFGLPDPIRVRPRRGADARYGSEPVTVPSASRDRHVKWFDPDGYRRYRDVGLMGFALDGSEDPGFRGRNSQRDGAFADALYGTGLRLSEMGSLLMLELPGDDPRRVYTTCRLAAECAKGGRGREYWMPRRTLVEVLGYVEGERARAVGRAQRADRYRRLTDARIIVSVSASRRVRLRGFDGGVSEVSLDTLDLSERRRLLVQGAEGLEPAAVWLNEDGLARDPHGWEHTFSQANARLARLGLAGFAGAPHMLRHSFALRWFSVGRLVYQARVAHLSGQETSDFREQFGDAWDLVQLMLGHTDPRSTRHTYLEPFRGLAVELLLAHAAEESVSKLMRAVFGRDGRVLTDPVGSLR
ncbi:site-specific integrase [Nocardia noduli]|uniref:site-specific integrase n=1 Tax=Nocardia noduli TaxID=2815722 RepID=UPI001C239CC9|nr:site-specific integrase [Nocardia noduli]